MPAPTTTVRLNWDRPNNLRPGQAWFTPETAPIETDPATGEKMIVMGIL